MMISPWLFAFLVGVPSFIAGIFAGIFVVFLAESTR